MQPVGLAEALRWYVESVPFVSDAEGELSALCEAVAKELFCRRMGCNRFGKPVKSDSVAL